MATAGSHLPLALGLAVFLLVRLHGACMLELLAAARLGFDTDTWVPTARAARLWLHDLRQGIRAI